MSPVDGTVGQTVQPHILDTSGGSNQIRVRAYNERLVLSLVRRHGALSKADIARRTGLSAQTVSVIMRALEKEGLLARGAPIRGRVGQPERWHDGVGQGAEQHPHHETQIEIQKGREQRRPMTRFPESSIH